MLNRVQLFSPMDCSPPGSSVHGIPRQEYWSGIPTPGDIPNPGIEPISLRLLHWQVYSLPLAPSGKPNIKLKPCIYRHAKHYQFISVTQLCLTLCNPMDCSTPGFLVRHQLPELAQTHVYRVDDAIQPSHPLSSPYHLSQHQGLFQWVSSFHQVAKVLEFQLQHQSFQWIFRTDFL